MLLLSAAKGEVAAVGFVPGRAAVVAAYESAGVFVWDLASSAAPVGFAKHQYFFPRTMALTPDGRHLVRHGNTGRVAFDLATGERTDAGPVGEALGDFAQTPDGTRLVLAHGSYWSPKKLTGWRADGAGWVKDWEHQATANYTGGVAVSADGRRLAHMCRNSGGHWPRYYEVVVRDAATGAEVGRGEYPYAYRCQLLLRPDGGQLLATHEMTLMIWPVPAPGKPKLVRNDNRKHFTSAAYHPSGRYLFTTSNDRTVLVWDCATWAHTARFSWDIGRLRSVAVSPDGSLAAAGSDKGQVVVWDVDL